MTVPRRILIAEDNDAARSILSDMCRYMGFEVDAVVHGQAAVDACRGVAYDVILMDCHMPVLDGINATRQIRTLETGNRRPVIIAVTGDGNRDQCMAAGMDDYLSKPVRAAGLRACLGRWLERRTPSGSLLLEAEQ